MQVREDIVCDSVSKISSVPSPFEISVLVAVAAFVVACSSHFPRSMYPLMYLMSYSGNLMISGSRRRATFKLNYVTLRNSYYFQKDWKDFTGGRRQLHKQELHIFTVRQIVLILGSSNEKCLVGRRVVNVKFMKNFC